MRKIEDLAVFARWHGSGIPERLWEQPVEERRDVSESFDAVIEWVEQMPQRQARFNGIPADKDGFGRGLLLCGPPGTGKTTAACAALTSVKRSHHKPVYFTRWPEYLHCRHELFNTSQTPEEMLPLFQMHKAVMETFTVVLDDVGHEHSSGSGFGERLLQETVRSRFDNGLPTIITTNLGSDEWAKRYDPALRSFIYQACPPVVFGGPDLRVTSFAA